MNHRVSLLRFGAPLSMALCALGCSAPAGPAGGPPAPPVADPAPMPLPDPPGPAPDRVPPPLSGGTLLIARDGVTAVAADPDRDAIYIVNLEKGQVQARVDLRPGDEPGRVTEDLGGRFHVVLRGGGAVMSFERDGSQGERRAVCPAPRGIAYDEVRDQVHVACLGGELVTLPPRGAGGARSLHLDRDLRDVVAQGSRLFISRFKAAQVLEITPDGAVLRRITPPTVKTTERAMTGPLIVDNEPAVAWRTIGLGGGRLAMLHQRGLNMPISTKTPSGYGGTGPCGGGIVRSTLTLVDPTGVAAAAPEVPMAVLPVDVALSRSGTQVAIVAAGNVQEGKFGPVLRYTLDQIGGTAQCLPFPNALDFFGMSAIAAAFDKDDRLVVQARQPAALHIAGGSIIPLSTVNRESVGHRLFHSGTRSLVACASCHPEGGEDGRTWTFEVMGLRRTQTVRGGILGTEPFHWDGDMSSFSHLASEVFLKRMGGPLRPASAGDIDDMARWLDSQPAFPRAAADPDAVSRGRAIFQDAAVGCASCHAGAKLTSNQPADVGTGGRFQVPTLLGIAHRAPFMHTGCAATLRDRFDACGGGDRHGKTSHLGEAELRDLVTYLETL